MTHVDDSEKDSAEIQTKMDACKATGKKIIEDEITPNGLGECLIHMNGDREQADPTITPKPMMNGHADGEGDHVIVSGESAHRACTLSRESTPKPDGDQAIVEIGDKKEDDDEKEDIILIQDIAFLISIHAPGVEPFDLPVSSMELVQEIYQVLVDREETCHRTCFSLQLDGQVLDNFSELKTIEGLKEGSVLKVVEEPYTIREARIHVRHVRDLLKSIDLLDAYNGVECNSLSFLNTVTAGDVLENLIYPDNKTKKQQENPDCTPPEYILPGNKERPLMPIHPLCADLTSPRCLRVLTYSGWNPPPGNRRMHGDLLYLQVVTLEGKEYHITGSSRGFYVNSSSQSEFNPRAAAQHHLSHSLIDLLMQISPLFKKYHAQLLKKRGQKHPFERVQTPYQVYSWLAPQVEHTVDSIRSEDAFSSRLGYEEHIPGQTRDWNEELQTTRELPRKTLPERLIRERAIFKVHSDFVVACTRGAQSVVDGNIMAINPGEEAKMQMFLWNNIFFSLGFDVKDHYADFGGDAAAYVAPGNDLQGVRAYTSVDAEGLYTLGTVLVDYRGYRVTAQSIIPGILEREQEQSVIYGSIDFGKTVVTHEKYKELLAKTSQNLKIRTHKVENEKGEKVELYSSVECKGIVGNDSRYYILDLLRTFPPDVNYLLDEKDRLSEEVRAMGYPKPHRHKLACLRHELIEAFVESRYMSFVKQAAVLFQQQRLKKMQDEKQENENMEKGEREDKGEKKEEEKEEETEPFQNIETNEARKLVEAITTESPETFEENTREVVKIVSAAVGSLSDTEFSMTFNPDVFQPHVKHADPESETLKREQKLVVDAAEFLLVHQIPGFLRDCLEHTSSPIDGYTLSEALHHNGINMRYLGKVTTLLANYSQLSYLHGICISELICRAAKHLFKTYMQGVEPMSLSAAISHFLNCFVGAYPTPHSSIATEELHSKRSSKRNRKKNKGLVSSDDNDDCTDARSTDTAEWATETPKTLWKRITAEVKEYYNFTIPEESLEAALEKYELQRVSILRSFCKKLGIQLLLREYTLDSRTRQAFQEEDIINMFPVTKHIHPKATDAYHVFTSGQQKIQQGLLRDGYELISEALNLLNNVYGAMHPEIAACARLLARLNYIMGDYAEALSFQQRAVLMNERVLGVDHPNTITEYAHLGLYCFANQQLIPALRLMYRARYLALLCHGENHPEVALFDSNIGLILQAVGEFELSLKFLQRALELNTRFFGEKSLKVAMSCHLVARAHSCKGDFRAALNLEKDAYAIYKDTLGDEHERTKESSECLKHLTTQAVKFQKTMNDIYKGEKTITIPPIQIQCPSHSNVLDTLNLINGIVFVHISPKDIERFRDEMMRRQQATGDTKTITEIETETEDTTVTADAGSKTASDSDSGSKSDTSDGTSSSASSQKDTETEVAS